MNREPVRRLVAPQAVLGWLLLLLGVFAWLVFGRHADWTSLRFWRQPLRQANGIVTGVRDAGLTIGDGDQGNPIMAVRFRFPLPGGVEQNGVSWTEHAIPDAGDQVRVEFVTAQPSLCRIVGFRSGPLPLWAGLVLFFPITGVYYILRPIFRRAKRPDAIDYRE
ncbi:MAG: hypothetical protein AAFU85_09580 [Planctomycetota bacterium]